MNARDFAIESLYTAACYADEDEWRPVFAGAVDRLITAAAEEAEARAEERWGQKIADAELAIEQQANAAQTLADDLAEMRARVDELETKMRTHKHGYVPPPRY